MIEKLIEDYRLEKRSVGGPYKQFRTGKIKCEAVDLSGKPIAGDCIVCVSHTFNNGRGYSKIAVEGKMVLLHRLVWKRANGREIPEGYQVDHICRNKGCINPEHLQLLSGESHRLKTLVEQGKKKFERIILKSFKHEDFFYQVWLGSFPK